MVFDFIFYFVVMNTLYTLKSVQIDTTQKGFFRLLPVIQNDENNSLRKGNRLTAHSVS